MHYARHYIIILILFDVLLYRIVNVLADPFPFRAADFHQSECIGQPASQSMLRGHEHKASALSFDYMKMSSGQNCFTSASSCDKCITMRTDAPFEREYLFGIVTPAGKRQAVLHNAHIPFGSSIRDIPYSTREMDSALSLLLGRSIAKSNRLCILDTLCCR